LNIKMPKKIQIALIKARQKRILYDLSALIGDKIKIGVNLRYARAKRVHMYEKGVSLYYAVVIISLLLAIAFGLTAILVGQIKISKEMGDSTIAFFAADSGMERILYLENRCYQASCPNFCNPTCQGLPLNYSTSSVLSNSAEYYTTVDRCHSFQSKGKFRDTTRKVEANRLLYKFVFATAVDNGDLEHLGGGTGPNPGVDGADNICNNRAAGAGLPGIYRAWITDTDDNTQPSTRFTHASVSYIRTDCAIVANNWADLTDGTILVPINRNESGGSITDGSLVFTNTNPDGTRTSNEGGFTCQNWTISDEGLQANYGIISSSELGAGWTATSTDHICNSQNYIYCFQQ